ncbi:p53 and DNA damage-regulated protein [Anaeramoeba ignava]|uniref:P53 and DNA damage-regulated protein n=1 Tax=Anaeramoeba ignava TaxID=1746090 RepID=A0A9Q0LUY2_ANAIG|nr:p53 and DNA damage-regulated protein [Anaeramoeba ignava]
MTDFENLQKKLIQMELLAEEILVEKHTLIEFDKKRQSNRESLDIIQHQSEKIKNKKIWLCLGEFFIKVPKENAKEYIKKDQKNFNQEIKRLQESIKEKSDELYKMQGDENKMKGFFLKPINKKEN